VFNKATCFTFFLISQAKHNCWKLKSQFLQNDIHVYIIRMDKNNN